MRSGCIIHEHPPGIWRPKPLRSDISASDWDNEQCIPSGYGIFANTPRQFVLRMNLHPCIGEKSSGRSFSLTSTCSRKESSPPFLFQNKTQCEHTVMPGSRDNSLHLAPVQVAGQAWIVYWAYCRIPHYIKKARLFPAQDLSSRNKSRPYKRSARYDSPRFRSKALRICNSLPLFTIRHRKLVIKFPADRTCQILSGNLNAYKKIWINYR